MNITELESIFTKAKNTKFEYIGVKVKTPISEEIIIFNADYFDSKLNYYKENYTENLELKHSSSVRIVDCDYGVDFDDIEISLMNKQIL